MNVCIFSGNLGRDAELSKLNDGTEVCNFPLAVNVGTKDAEATMWVSCAVFGKRAGGIAPYLAKGMKVTVAGRVKLETYKSKDGEEKTALRMSCNDVDLPRREKPDERPAEKASASKQHEEFDSEIPW